MRFGGFYRSWVSNDHGRHFVTLSGKQEAGKTVLHTICFSRDARDLGGGGSPIDDGGEAADWEVVYPCSVEARMTPGRLVIRYPENLLVTFLEDTVRSPLHRPPLQFIQTPAKYCADS